MRGGAPVPPTRPSQPRAGSGRPRVAYVLSEFPVLSETFILREIDMLDRIGVEVQPYSMRPVREDALRDDMMREWWRRTVYLPAPQHPRCLVAGGRALLAQPASSSRRLASVVGHSEGHRRTLMMSLGLFPQGAYFARRLREDGIDWVHAHFGGAAATLAWYAGAMTGRPFSFTPHAGELYTEWFRDRALALKVNAAAFVVAISEYNRRYLMSLSDDGALEKFPLVRYGLGPDYLQEPSPERRRGGGPPLVLSVGRLVEKKGHEYLVRALARLRSDGRSFRCVIVGDGPLRPSLASLIRELGMEERVDLVGSMPQARVQELLGDASIFCLAAVVAEDGDLDGLPNVLIEALAREVPTVSTSVSAIPELIEHEENGLIVAPRDDEALAAAIDRLLSDAAFARALGREGRRVVLSRFDLRKEAEKLAGLFRTGWSAYRDAA